MLPSLLVYAGLLTALVGVLGMIRRLGALLRLRNRSQATVVCAAGLALASAGFAWPATLTRSGFARSRLDEFVPAYQFSEFHSIRVAAPCDRAYRAVRAVTPDEIRLLRTLTWIRRGGRSIPEGVLRPPPDTPILDVMLRTGFLLLAEDEGREIVVGTLVVAPPG